MLRNLLFSATLVGGIVNSSEASALTKSADIPISIAVQSPDEAPIPTAHIRHSEEAMLHDVNHETGRWSGDSLYLKDGTRVPFKNKQVLRFDVSAPGYQSSVVEFRLRKRMNHVRVILTPIDFDTDIEIADEPNINFYRSRPHE